MKRLLIAGAFAALALSGCAATRYQWSSMAGRDCFWSCQNIVNTCSASCGGPSPALNPLRPGMGNNRGKDWGAGRPALGDDPRTRLSLLLLVAWAAGCAAPRPPVPTAAPPRAPVGTTDAEMDFFMPYCANPS